MKTLIYLVSVVILLLPEIASAETPIVYSSCVRTTTTHEVEETINVSGSPQLVSRTFTKLDVYDVLPDVTNFFTGFSAPCDIVYRDAAGVETVLYDCSTSSNEISGCAALDPKPSPDNTKVAFSVFKGYLDLTFSEYVDARILHVDADSGQGFWVDWPVKRLVASGAQLMYYDFVSEEVVAVLPYTGGVWDAGPAWLNNDRLAFTSTRDNHKTTIFFHTTSSRLGTKIYGVDVDGSNLDVLSHHSLSQEQHPFMLKDGRLVFSSWQIFGGLPFRHNNGTVGGQTTEDNLFHIYSMLPDGAKNFPIYGQHSGDHSPSYFGEDHNAAHFITQTTDGRIWFADYYRGNNHGHGALVGVIAEPSGREGKGIGDISSYVDLFIPNDVVNFASWATNGDNSTMVAVPGVTHANYSDPIPWRGRLSHPFGLPSNGLGMSWAKGHCSVVGSTDVYIALGLTPPPAVNNSGGGNLINNVESLNLDVPGCDAGIYKRSTATSSHPDDLVMIVDSTDRHEIMGRAMVPYADIHGQAMPDQIARSDIRTSHALLDPGTPFGLFGAASITDRETAAFGGIIYPGASSGAHKEHHFNLQGTDIIDYADDELCGVRILGVLPNRGATPHLEINNHAGERLRIWGEVPVLHYNGETRIMDPSDNPDTSFLVRFPANTPHLTQGIDCDGRTLNTDQTWQSLRPGEKKTCGGCHVHSRDARITFDQSYAATVDYTVPQLGEGTVPLLDGKTGNVVNTRTVSGYGMTIDFTTDIKPIFDARCVSCHSGGSPAGGLNLDATGQTNTDVGSVWYCLAADRLQTCQTTPFVTNETGNGIRRPWVSKYIKAFGARASLLYWKAAGQRTDNLLDTDRTDDIDFGAAHTTSITSDELGILSRWIDIGAPGGAQETKDTQKPTLHIAATVADNGGTLEITHLHVGTVDLGDGIDTSTLSVQIDGGSNIAPSAQPHGITTIALGTPISDTSAVITASVSDQATSPNTTTMSRTAGYFLADASGPSPVSISVGANQTITEGDTFNRTITFTDGEDTDTDGWTYDIDWCGTPENGNTVAAGQSSFSISRLFSSSGSCVVTVTITDDVGETDSGNFTLTINAASSPDPLSISVGGRGIVKEGSTYSRIISINDGEDTGSNGWTYSFTVDGVSAGSGSVSAGSSSFTISHTFPDGDKRSTVAVNVVDVESTDEANGSFEMIIQNVPPVAVITANDTATVDSPYSISYQINDPGDDTVAAVSIDWGDGATGDTTTHTYTETGSYTIRVWVDDDDGLWMAGAKRITVQ